MEEVKVLIWGFGAMGQGMARMLLTKKGVKIVGVCDLNPHLVGRSMGRVLGHEESHEDVIIEQDIDLLLRRVKADVALLATDSFVKGAFDKIVKVAHHHINIISTAEEMAYPKAQHPELALALDKVAKDNGITILGTGINPGFILDLLVVAMSGVMTEVKTIEARRVNSLSPFGETVMHEQGVGISLSEFTKRSQDKTLAGHVGFHESIAMIQDALGLELNEFRQQMEPIITNVDRKSPYGEAKKGHLAGINMTAQGLKNNEVIISMIHPQQIEPEMEGTSTGDYITIKGTPEVNLSITPEIEGGLGTIAMCVNMIPHVINATPGLKTMLDLPVPRAICGDMRTFIDK